MTDNAHSITEAQYSTEARELRAAAAAQKTLVGRQDRIAVVASFVVPTLFVILKTIWEPITPLAVLYAFGVLLASLLGFDRIRAARLHAAARSRERHDCSVLDLPWNPRTAGGEPSPAEQEAWRATVAAAKNAGSDQGPGDPFPREVDELPLPYARLACQSLALYWEPAAVQRYIKALWLGTGTLVLALVIASLAVRPEVESAATTLLALTPLVFWAWREQRRWHTSGQLAGRVLQRLGSAWRSAMAATIQAGSLPSLARGIQDDIYLFRLQQPVIPRWAAKRYWQRLSFDARRIDTFVDEFEQRGEQS